MWVVDSSSGSLIRAVQKCVAHFFSDPQYVKILSNVGPAVCFLMVPLKDLLNFRFVPKIFALIWHFQCKRKTFNDHKSRFNPRASVLHGKFLLCCDNFSKNLARETGKHSQDRSIVLSLLLPSIFFDYTSFSA